MKRCHCYERTGTLECWASPRRWCNYNSPANKERRSSGTPTVEGSTQAAQPPGHRLLICELPKIQLWHNAAAGCKAEKQTAWFNSMILVSFGLYLFLSHFMKGSHRKENFSISILFISSCFKYLSQRWVQPDTVCLWSINAQYFSLEETSDNSRQSMLAVKSMPALEKQTWTK